MLIWLKRDGEEHPDCVRRVTVIQSLSSFNDIVLITEIGFQIIMFRTLLTLFAFWGIGDCAPRQSESEPWRPVVAVPEAAAVRGMQSAGIGRNGEENCDFRITNHKLRITNALAILQTLATRSLPSTTRWPMTRASLTGMIAFDQDLGDDSHVR